MNEQVAALLIAVTGVGPGNSLANKVTAVQDYLALPDIATACSALDDFNVTVTSQSGKKITTALANQFRGRERDRGGDSVPLSRYRRTNTPVPIGGVRVVTVTS